MGKKKISRAFLSCILICALLFGNVTYTYAWEEAGRNSCYRQERNEHEISEETKQEQEEEKELLREFLQEGEDIIEGVTCVEDEVVVSVTSRQQAEDYANAFAGEVAEYYDDFAVIRLLDTEDGFQTVEHAVVASASENNDLPPVWPNYYYYISEEKEDPYLSVSASSYQWHHEVIKTKQAWAYGYKGNGIKVAVLDTGINTGHEDIYASSYEINDTYGIEDMHGHGTHVAALIGGRLGNGSGGAGVAPQAHIISIKVMGNDGKGDMASIMAGIERAISTGADVINMSLGGASYARPFEEKVIEAYEQGVAVFAAAGNDGIKGCYYPASYEGAISVAAMDKSNERATFSNYGPYVRYSAPGVDLYSAASGSSGSYMKASGTSQATPLISGIAAVILSSGEVTGSGAKKVDNLLKVMDQGCKKINSKGMGRGYVDLAKALKLDEPEKNPSAPVFSHKGGTYEKDALLLHLSAGPFSTIYYSVDGKKVTYKDGKLSENAKEYDPEKGITVSGNKINRITAIAVSKQNGLASKAVSAVYKIKPADEIKEEKEEQITKNLAISGNHVVVRGKSITLKPVFEPENVTNKKVSWRILESNTNVKLTKNGKLMAHKNAVSGNCIVEAMALDGSGVRAQFQVNITEQGIRQIGVSKKEVKLFRCDNLHNAPTKEEIFVTIEGENKDNWTVVSNKEGIVTVEKTKQGILIKAVGKAVGKAVITISSTDGTNKKVKCNVTVLNPPAELKIAPKQGRSHFLAEGKSLVLAPVFEMRYGKVKYQPKDLIWTSSSPKVTVDKKGIVTSRTSDGTEAVIMAKTADGSNLAASYTIKTCEAVHKLRFQGITGSHIVIPFGKAYGFSYEFLDKTGNIMETGGSGQITAEINKAGVTPYFAKNSQGKKVMGLMANQRGIYKLQLSMKDGSKAKKTYTIHVY